MTDLEMMKAPNKWERWPLLPIVRDHKLDPNTGIMVEGILKVYHVNLWELKTGSLADILKDVPSVEYDSLEGIIADGWKVD
tara:strand:+ start:535 stop:777 length:243 start_codon:yes stop_codon:yes gene_type:complete